MSTGFEFEMPSEQTVEEGGFSAVEPGTYLVAVAYVEMDPVTRAGEVRDGMNVHFQVVTGTTPGQENKIHREFFAKPSPNHKDGGTFARNKIGFLALATEICSRGQCGQQVTPQFDEMVGKVCYITLKKSNDERYREIEGLSILHVNDPKAAKFPREDDVIEQCGMTWKPNGSAAATATQAAPAKAAAAAPKPGAPKAGARKPAGAAPATAGNGESSAPAKAADAYADL